MGLDAKDSKCVEKDVAIAKLRSRYVNCAAYGGGEAVAGLAAIGRFAIDVTVSSKPPTRQCDNGWPNESMRLRP